MEVGHRVVYIDKGLANWRSPFYGGVEYRFLGFISETVDTNLFSYSH